MSVLNVVFEDSSWEAFNGSGCCRLAEGHKTNGPRCQATRLCSSSKFLVVIEKLRGRVLCACLFKATSLSISLSL